jgi:alanyl-tRNA synthetase
MNCFLRELCCGTHTLSTKDIEDFAITTVRGIGSHSPTIRAVVGEKAVQVIVNSGRERTKSID